MIYTSSFVVLAKLVFILTGAENYVPDQRSMKKSLPKISLCLGGTRTISSLQGCTFFNTWTYCLFENQQIFSALVIGDFLKGWKIQNPARRKSMS